MTKKTSDAARQLSILGASKGGKARASKLSVEERKEIAKKAAVARWGERIPVATHGDPEHPLRIGDIEIQCYVLEDGTRVISQRGLQTSIGLSVSGGAQRLLGILSKLAAKGVDTKNLESRVGNPVFFQVPGGGKAHGFEATVLADFCEVILAARKIKGALQPNQTHVAEQCEILMRGFARVGIIALVDEATGYQFDRPRQALEKILEAFISKELVKWLKMFPDEFYEQLFKLRGWTYSDKPSKRPMIVGQLTINLVYERLAPGVLQELTRLNPRTPRGHRKHKLFQRLTEDVGHPKLREHLASVIALMRSSDDWDDFYKRLDRALPKYKPMPLFDKRDGVEWSTEITAEQENEQEAAD